MQVEVLHGNHLGIATSCCAALQDTARMGGATEEKNASAEGGEGGAGGGGRGAMAVP
jgi:hypothetical protein